MTIKEFYKRINGNYEDVLLRLPTEAFVKRFVKRFADDTSFSELEKAIAEQNIKESFEASHKLKGIAANLSFTQLYERLIVLTDQLRPQTEVANEILFHNVRESYECIITNIKGIED